MATTSPATTQTATTRTIVAAPADPIRVVPLHVPEGLLTPTAEAQAGASPAHLTYRGGPLLASVEVFTIFWGTPWQTAPQSQVASSINDFFDFLLTSPLIDQLAEYNVPQYTIGHGRRTGTATITTPHPRHSVTDSRIRHFLQQEILTNNAIPQPGSNTLYFIYLPPGVAVVQGGGKSCMVFCGYHDAINSQVFYAVMPYANCPGCLGGLSTLDALTSTSSHELCEAITDAVPGSGWYDDANGEIGDICAWKTKQLGNFMVQLEWSNQADSCK